MTQYGYALLGLTAVVAMLVGVLMFAFMRFASAARDAKGLRASGTETALLSAALQEAVTKVKAQEKAMSDRAAASEALSGQIVGSLTAGLLVVDRAGIVEILNPAGRRLLGMTGSPVGGLYREILSSVPPLAELIEECLRSMQPIARRTVQVPSGDHVMHLGVTVSPLGGTSDARGIICLFSDLTNVFELEEQLRLKETLARLGELTAGLAHEFRNGLATIHGYGRLIDPQALPPQYQPYIEGIRQETDALGKVVTNFLNFARPDQLQLSPVDLGALVRRGADDVRQELPSGGTIVTTGEFGTIQGDEVLLRQAFSNLVRNAIEACSGSGVTPLITIEGQTDAQQRTARVAVSDNGPGIPEAARERIFRPFFTTRAQGTGLGLAIVQKIVVTHNGRVSLATSAAGGASFQLTFPLTEPSPLTGP